MTGLLDGVLVLEVAVLFNGDVVGQHLGDLGADVIKIESPGRGDYLRDMLGQIAPHQSPAHLQVNRTAIGRPELTGGDEPGGAPVEFGHGDDALRRELEQVFATRTQQEWIGLAIEHDVPLGPAHQGVGALLDDAHVRARNIVVEGNHPAVGPFTYVGSPVIVDGEQFEVARPAPGLGQHTDEVLAEIGIDHDEIARLRAAGVV